MASKQVGSIPAQSTKSHAVLAQLVERRPEEPGVDGSIPSDGTILTLADLAHLAEHALGMGEVESSRLSISTTFTETTMTTNIVFLDFDDVLNNGTTDCESMAYIKLIINRNRGLLNQAQKDNIDEYAIGLFKPDCVATLNQVLKTFQAKVVLSTNWMEHLTLDDVHQLFEANGVKGLTLHEQCPITPRQALTRAGQIEDALKLIAAPYCFVILDDRMSGTGLAESEVLNAKTVWCDRDEHGDFWGQGLQPVHLDLMAEHLELK